MGLDRRDRRSAGENARNLWRKSKVAPGQRQPRSWLQRKFGMELIVLWATAGPLDVVGVVEERALWNRYGLLGRSGLALGSRAEYR